MKIIAVIAALFSITLAIEKPFIDSDHVYIYEEVSGQFNKILVDELKPEFEKWLKVLFAEGFPLPIHNNEKIVQCWNCLYKQMVTAAAKQDSYQGQSRALHMLLMHHENSIKNHAPELYAELESIVNNF